MSETYIQDWSGERHIRLNTLPSISPLAPAVRISQVASGMCFVHTLTPDQAREMAHALVEFAKEAEDIAKETP